MSSVTTLLGLYSCKKPIKFNPDFQERKLSVVSSVIILSFIPIHIPKKVPDGAIGNFTSTISDGVISSCVVVVVLQIDQVSLCL